MGGLISQDRVRIVMPGAHADAFFGLLGFGYVGCVGFEGNLDIFAPRVSRWLEEQRLGSMVKLRVVLPLPCCHFHDFALHLPRCNCMTRLDCGLRCTCCTVACGACVLHFVLCVRFR